MNATASLAFMNPEPAMAESNSDRNQAIDAFLASAGWAGARRMHLAGDASFRKYERILHEGRHAVLMNAPPPYERVTPFMQVTEILRGLKLSAPEIYASDEAQGFLLLEDLGDDAFTRVLTNAPQQEGVLYRAAMDALIALQTRCAALSAKPQLAPYNAETYLREAALFSDWFLPQVAGRDVALGVREEFLALWQGLLKQCPLQNTMLVHRDYHADNLLWLPQRTEEARVGMIDYQDALMGDPFYDVVSLLEDARRDVSEALAEEELARFIAKIGADTAEARYRYAVLGAQRNMKIVGIFTRLSVRDGKPNYLNFLPRVWGYLINDLAHPGLKPLRDMVEKYVPASARGIIKTDRSLAPIVS
jgi:aminoglycoside/choline kinase family phosphotransferase